MDMRLLRTLVNTHGPSGREEDVADVVRAELADVCDAVERDAMGSLIGRRPAATRAGRGSVLLLAAHMDELGLLVTGIEDTGFVRVIALGGWDPRTLVSQVVLVHGRKRLRGVVGTPPVHVLDEQARGKAPKIDDLVIDLGLPADRVRELVRVGDVATRDRPLQRIGDLVTGKALDDRVGVFVMLEGVRAAGACPWDLAAAATVQEEVGLRGARTVAFRERPRVGIAIDTCPSGDGPGMKGGGTRLGKGAAIRIMDASAIGSRRLVEFMEAVARDAGIPHQFHASGRGGTDTQALQLAGTGCAAGCISIPQRYGHSSVEAVHPGDVEACVHLLSAVIERVGELGDAVPPPPPPGEP
ncbi:MAG: M20/M25/M40 family metallo-hydrolase [Thermoleophilia bacterium]|nr:M20/M25/M40 family metallo-hydrolase [Thermoleophilia bacterium]